MMTELSTVRIGGLGRVVTGKTPPSSQPELFGELYPFLTPTDIDGVARYVEITRFLSIEGCDYQHRLMLPARAVCVVCIGATIGKVCMTNRPSFTNQQVNSVIVNENEHDPFFVYHLLATLRDELKANAGGAATPIINKTAFSEIEVNVPSLSVQQRIAGILSAYDELIENNQRRIQILETMARALYREWFVEFRFPGHEKIPRVASAVGDIPKGWEAVPFEMLLASMTGGDWGSDQPTERESTEVRIVRGTDFDEVAYGGELRAPFRFIKPSSLKSRGLRPGDVIVENSINAKSRCVGTTLLVDQELLARIGRSAVAASFCKVFRLHDPRIAPLVHLHIRGLRQEGRMEYYQNVATNGIGNFQAQTFAKKEHLTLPKNESLRSKLLERIDQMFACVGVMSSQLAYLRRTRDLLLPRLLSGQVTLTDTVA